MADPPDAGRSELSQPVTDRDHTIGSADAAVTLVEYGDYECPDCFNAVPVVERQLSHFGDRLRVVYRHFPLNSIHPHASAAARAAEAAHVQKRFWDMHAALFKNQKHLADADLLHLAINIGLEVYRFQSDMGSEAIIRRVRADVASGGESGVKGTPTFFINGKRFDGEETFDALRDAIEQAG